MLLIKPSSKTKSSLTNALEKKIVIKYFKSLIKIIKSML